MGVKAVLNALTTVKLKRRALWEKTVILAPSRRPKEVPLPQQRPPTPVNPDPVITLHQVGLISLSRMLI
jgi:hypothetical protein